MEVQIVIDETLLDTETSMRLLKLECYKPLQVGWERKSCHFGSRQFLGVVYDFIIHTPPLILLKIEACFPHNVRDFPYLI